jgi:hypothetical protein
MAFAWRRSSKARSGRTCSAGSISLTRLVGSRHDNGKNAGQHSTPESRVSLPEELSRQTSEQAAEQTRRIEITAAKASEEVSRVSADLLNQNAEILQNTWRFGMEAVAEAMNRSSDHLARTFGWTGEAQQATETSVRNTQSVMESATAVSKGLNEDLAGVLPVRSTANGKKHGPHE